MMHALAIPVAVIACLAAVTNGQNQQYCTASSIRPTTATNINAPPLPELPTSFYTQVEANIVNNAGSYTMMAEEFYDGVKNRGTLRLKRAGGVRQFNYDYVTKQLYVSRIGPDGAVDCIAEDIRSQDGQYFFGYSNGTIYTVDKVLRFGKKFNEVYIGRETVRGISVDHYRSCINDDAWSGSFTVDYYFTASGVWSPVNQRGVPVPVRALVQGFSTRGESHNFTNSYEFFSFQPNYTFSETDFETPVGAYCASRLNPRPMKPLDLQFSYMQEIYLPRSSIIQLATVYYDFQYKLLRYDYRNPDVGIPPWYTDHMLKEVHDYNTGVKYVTDTVLGNCSIRALGLDGFDSTINEKELQKTGGYALRLKNPMELFFLDSESYVYVGQRLTRGIRADVYVTQRNDYPVPGHVDTNVTIEAYFLSSDVREVSPGSIVDSGFPIQLVITSAVPEVDFKISYNFFNFDQEHPDLNNFEIIECFPEAVKKHFRIKLPRTSPGLIVDYMGIETRALQLELAQFAGVSPQRIQRPQLQYDSQAFYVVSTLLERAPYSAQFTVFADETAYYGSDKIINNIGDIDSCGELCLDPAAGGIPCNSFDYCPQEKMCILSRTHQGNATSVNGKNPLCSHWTRNVDFPGKAELPLQAAWLNLTNSVNAGSVWLSVAARNGSMYKIKSSSIRDDIERPTLPTRIPTTTPGPSNPTPGPTAKQQEVLVHDSNTGAMVGLAVGMLVLGLLLGAGALYGFLRLKRHTLPDNMQLSFVNKENSE
ncbi:uncharacterized protein LOC106165633 [Lingula anatina]|uniref:Uncharacterized protein LOC106165633 n=1 Tax=Lingula anatina TaxID=7574 RepID=A0A1S3IMR2_LINAN|nr:uncharacterized protein LOC106165633 [Lingula anatina]|eukprot:XP_013399378.1 uncharacterized protein LOC106165633 [Lingula anatina]